MSQAAVGPDGSNIRQEDIACFAKDTSNVLSTNMEMNFLLLQHSLSPVAYLSSGAAKSKQLLGWHESVESYSIGVGYFLVFMYEGESNFNMFDLTVQESNHEYPGLLPHEKDDGLKNLGFHQAPIKAPFKDGCIQFERKISIFSQFDEREHAITEDGVSSFISGIAEKTSPSKRMIETHVDKHESLVNQKVKLKSARAKITSETQTRRWRAATPLSRFHPTYSGGFFWQDLGLDGATCIVHISRVFYLFT
ncbi:hypothetical protein SADUNF_Sadunf09G0087900 [Salix dunnii]|uniref:Uncharacterized protein n=1 Tax=Salix dunnii TaxID=1413687 RepID=A0A835JV27_9ROSI|nr:hypothetical protein SADUNF_Sadunf09G0087900 [Salix dunnii]